MRNLRKLLHILVALALALNGAGAAHAALQDAGSPQGATTMHDDSAPPCHGDASDGDEPPISESPEPGCCEVGACLCSVSAAYLAIGVTSPATLPPERTTRPAEIEQGHSSPRPSLLLRPPNL